MSARRRPSAAGWADAGRGEGARPRSSWTRGRRLTASGQAASACVITFSAEADEGPTTPVTLQDGEAAEWVFNANKLLRALGGKKPLVQMVALDSEPEHG